MFAVIPSFFSSFIRNRIEYFILQGAKPLYNVGIGTDNLVVIAEILRNQLSHHINSVEVPDLNINILESNNYVCIFSVKRIIIIVHDIVNRLHCTEKQESSLPIY